RFIWLKKKREFKIYIPVERPVINVEAIPDPSWLAGFVSGDGCFEVKITKSTKKIGHRVQLSIKLTQHIRGIKLMELIAKYLLAGKEYKYSQLEAVYINIVNFNHLITLIISFFTIYNIRS
uniref:LAGLIDADG homing endonuclease n=1 Tax=Cyathus jiayuguanensis TaxID=380660 RepID=UPI0023F22CDA